MQPDTLTYTGAEIIARTIREFWHSRGYTRVRVERFELGEGYWKTWGVRSNLVNGLPPEVTKPIRSN
jgi:hypothetical protein